MSETASPYTRRIERAAGALECAGLDALLLTPGPDMFYLSGFEHGHAFRRLLALIVRRDGSSSWIAPEMNVPQVRDRALPGQPVRGWGDAEGYLPALREAVQGVRALGFDEEARAAFLMDLQEAEPGIRIAKSGAIARELRIRKDAEELRCLRVAAGQADRAIPGALAACRPGRPEFEVERLLRTALGEDEAPGTVAFSIVAAGKNGALPHHETSRDPLREGDVVILDFGTRFEGYHSDITVTCALGEPSDPEARKVYRTVWEAQQKAFEAIRPGVACEAVDRAARSHIEAAGYGEYFIHRTGHGLGLQLHEPPFIVGGNGELLEEGMVFSVEPGIYLPGRFGVRLEVIGTVTGDGVELLNAPRPPELPVVPL